VDKAKVIYSVISSFDGYFEDEEGRFSRAARDEEVHAFVNDLERPIGTYLYGRRIFRRHPPRGLGSSGRSSRTRSGT
jgi:hypothetical protein